MSDNLESFVRQHREEFDDAEPTLGHRRAFRRRLEEERRPEPKKVRWQWVAAAAVAGLLLAFGLVQLTGGEEETIPIMAQVDPVEASPILTELADLSPEHAEAISYFQLTADRKQQEVNALEPANAEAVKFCMEQLEYLERDYQDMREDLTASGGSERVVNMMVVNYRMRIEILDRLLSELEAMNQRKSQYHETDQRI